MPQLASDDGYIKLDSMKTSHGKKYVISEISGMSESKALSSLVTDTKAIPKLEGKNKGDIVTLTGKIVKVDKPEGADYPYYVLDFKF